MDLDAIVSCYRAQGAGAACRVQKPPLKSYRELIAWQRAMSLVERVREFALTLPRGDSALASQLNRAAVSIPANIAEGYGRAARGDYLRFLAIAVGSLREVETLALIAQRAGVGSPEKLQAVLDMADECGAVLYGLRRSLSPQTKKAPRWPA